MYPRLRPEGSACWVRDGSFYPDALEKGLRSERALTLTLAEMYVQGVSTRRVKTVIEQMYGTVG